MMFLETREGRRAATRTSSEAREFMRSTDGWRVVSGESGDRCGMVAHRGVMHPDEYVDREALVAAVEARLGFTVAQLREVYVQGRKSRAQHELRARVDARLLAVARSGGNMTLLARATGLSPETVWNALKRARGS